MDTPAFSTFFALLALACWAAVVVVGFLGLANRYASGSPLASAYQDIRAAALWLAWIVALVTTMGSLYYSQVAHYVPCPLCWYQRIAMYPLAITLLVAALRGDRNVWWYVIPPALIGAGFALYHAQLQAFPAQQSAFCTTTEPCTTRYVWEFGFVSLPLMALSAFVFIIVMMLVILDTNRDPAANAR